MPAHYDHQLMIKATKTGAVNCFVKSKESINDLAKIIGAALTNREFTRSS